MTRDTIFLVIRMSGSETKAIRMFKQHIMKGYRRSGCEGPLNVDLCHKGSE
jgi:hypothetical protein